MQTQIIDGKLLADDLLASFLKKRELLGFSPRLLIIQIGNDPASIQFVSLKKKRGEQIGINVEIINLPVMGESELIEILHKTIEDHRKVTQGIMIQLPLPKGIDTEKVLSLIPPELDVDGLLLQQSPYNTAVADAVLYVLGLQGIRVMDKKILVLGESPYVGNSIISALKLAKHENVSSINENSDRIPEQMKDADIVISCIGKPHIYTAHDIKEGALLIDVGTSKNIEGKIVGDFDISNAQGHLVGYTPVPGGVGPLTVAMLLKHTLDNARLVN